MADNKQLFQKSWSVKKEIFIKEDHLFVRSKNSREELEYKIKFDDLGFETFRKKSRDGNTPFYFFLCVTLLNIYLILHAVLRQDTTPEVVTFICSFAIFGTITFYFFSQLNQPYIYLTGGPKALELLAMKPDKETVDKFIKDVHNAIRIYHKINFYKADEETSYEHKLARLKWMLQRSIITDEEFDEMFASLKTANIIGFGRFGNSD